MSEVLAETDITDSDSDNVELSIIRQGGSFTLSKEDISCLKPWVDATPFKVNTSKIRLCWYWGAAQLQTVKQQDWMQLLGLKNKAINLCSIIWQAWGENLVHTLKNRYKK